MVLLSVTQTIKNIEFVLLGIFNGGMLVRIIKTLMDGQVDEEVNVKKKIINYIKAAIIINTIASIVLIIRFNYIGANR